MQRRSSSSRAVDEILDGGIVAASEALARGAISSRELTAAALARIAACDGAFRAFLRVDAEAAFAQADERDRERRRGFFRGPLHGIPVARKDLFDRAGSVASCGSRGAARPAAETATCLARLDAAGAVDLGALNMSEFAFHPHGLNALAGPARNPWDSARVAGGSSGGSAAALAARFVFGSMGSDSGGSIRHPAALCGVAGLLPTRGAISRFGMMRSSPSLDAAGPMARTALDCGLIHAAVAGPDPRDPEADMPVRPLVTAAGASLRGRAIARIGEALLASIAAEARQAYEDAAAAMRAAGAKLVEGDLPDWDALNALTAIVFASEVAATHRRRLTAEPDAYSPEVRERMAAGFVHAAADYIDALRVRARMTRRFVEAVFARAEALLLPAAPDIAPRLDEVMPGAAARRYDAGAFTLATPADPGRFTRAFNYLGLPALALPAGFSREALPLGIQLVARPLGEPTLFEMGRAFQEITDHHKRRPPPSSGRPAPPSLDRAAAADLR
jgi:aspartyl-tRNA(Asn)/glutamyl-tRNA(Gln) amidotransferase subunit A